VSLTRTEITKIVQIVRASGLTEVRIEHNGEGVVICDPNAIAPKAGGELIAIAAPAVGSIFYERTKVGQRVSKGDMLGRLRVLGTEIPIAAPASGRIAAVLADDGSLVAFGENLVLIDLEQAP